SPYKGIEYFCEAIEIVNKIIPEAKFFILGNGKFYFDIDKYLQKLPIFILNKYIDNSTLAYYLSKSSVTVLPYLDSTQSGVVITSYSFNKPVIATATGGIPEIVIEGKTGYLIPPKNSKLLAEKLIDLFLDRDKLTNMQKTINEMKTKKEYEFLSWEKISEETIIFYKKCIENFND
ncbi:MAG: glycosyltransferase, partial [bacterium]|nr:glycosyltransferase [bacterium]